jgi:hypothetical protein
VVILYVIAVFAVGTVVGAAVQVGLIAAGVPCVPVQRPFFDAGTLAEGVQIAVTTFLLTFLLIYRGDR